MFSALHAMSACGASSIRRCSKRLRYTARAARRHVFLRNSLTRRTPVGASRGVAKAEQIEGKGNPRYVVTSLNAANWPARKLYEELYCARGDMENRIKEQYSLFAGRVSAATMRANQLRLYLSAAADVLMSAFRRLALSGTAWARAQCETIRSQLLRIGAQVRITARKVWISIASSYPHWRVFAQAHQQLRC